RFFLSRGWGISSGGARGADTFALSAVVAAGSEACARSGVFLPAPMSARDAVVQSFVGRGGRGRTWGGGGGGGRLGRSAGAGAAARARGGRRGGVPARSVAGLGVHRAGSDPRGEAGGSGPHRRRCRAAGVRGRSVVALPAWHRRGAAVGAGPEGLATNPTVVA